MDLMVLDYSALLTNGYYYPTAWTGQVEADLDAASSADGFGFTYATTMNLTTYALAFTTEYSAALPGTFPAAIINMDAPTTAQVPLGLTTGQLNLPVGSQVAAPNPCSLYKSYTASVAPGQYEATAFLTALEASLNAASTASGFDVDFTPSTVNAAAGKFTFAVTNGAAGAGSFINFTATTADAVIGVPESGNSPIIVAASPYTTPLIFNLAGPRELNIRCKLLGKQCVRDARADRKAPSWR